MKTRRSKPYSRPTGQAELSDALGDFAGATLTEAGDSLRDSYRAIRGGDYEHAQRLAEGGLSSLEALDEFASSNDIELDEDHAERAGDLGRRLEGVLTLIKNAPRPERE